VNFMAKQDDFIIIINKKKKHNSITLIFFTIIAFIAIFIPLLGSTIRYQASFFFQNIFNIFGSICKLAGMVMIGFTFLAILANHKIYTKSLLFGAFLIWIGCFLTYTPFTLFGITLGGLQPPIGYH